MTRPFSIVVLVLALAVSTAFAQAGKPPATSGEDRQARPTTSGAAEEKSATAESASGVLDFTVKDIDGNDVKLSKYRGNVLLIVNVASKCGFTPQYAQLQELYEKYRERGLRILAFPANNFANQEPGTNAEIKEFCTGNYGVTFDLFAKISVRGADAAPLYRFLSSTEKIGDLGQPISWNFTKFLVDRDGKVINRFDPRLPPDAAPVVRAIEAALDQPPASQPADGANGQPAAGATARPAGEEKGQPEAKRESKPGAGQEPSSPLKNL